MKRVDDQKIKEMMKGAQKYEITSTSEQILAKKAMIPVEEPKVKNKKMIFGFSFGLLTASLAAGILAFIPLFKQAVPGGEQIVINLKANTNEVGVFSNLISLNNNTSTRQMRRSSISLTDFENTMRVYEKLNEGITNLFTEQTSLTYQGEYQIDEKTYSYKTVYKLNGEEISEFYFNTSKDDDEQEINGEIYFKTDNTKYNVYSLIESESDEQEIETLFYNDDKTEIFSIEEEKEFEGVESENSYSYYKYDSINNYKSDNYIFGLEYSFEDEEIEMNYYETDKEYKFSEIKKINEEKYEFAYEAELEESDEEYESKASLEYIIKDENLYHRYQDLNDLNLFLEIIQ